MRIKCERSATVFFGHESRKWRMGSRDWGVEDSFRKCGEREKRNSLPGKEVSQQRKRGSRHRRGGNSQRLPENNENHVSGSVSSFTWLLGSSSQILRSASKTV